MRYLYISSLLVALTASTALIAPFTLLAESTVIQSISVQTHTGGNTSSNGSSVSGTSHSSVDITTTINGEIVEDIHKTSTGEPVHIERTVVATSSRAITNTRVDMFSDEAHESSTRLTQTHGFEEASLLPASTTPITNYQNAIENIVAEVQFPETENIPLFAHFFTTVAQTFTYVLSNIFGYPITTN